MPTVVPPFVAYQAPLIALRGLWNNAPPEGDKFIPVEIDWSAAGAGRAVQISVSSFSSVAFTQIVALYVDNAANGSDVTFMFPDTGKQLTVPATCQGLFPVITNSLTFYVISPSSGAGDQTIFQILNSMPPPVAILPSQEQSQAALVGVSLTVDSTTPLVAAPASGTLTALDMRFTNDTADTITFTAILQDGNGKPLWVQAFTMLASTQQQLGLPGLRVRFYNGLSFIIGAASGPAGTLVCVNAYYSTP